MSNKNKSISARARFSGLLAFILAAVLTPAGKIIATAVAGAAIIGGLSLAPQKPVTQEIGLQDPEPQIMPTAMPPLDDAQEALDIETDSGPVALVLNDTAEPPTGGGPGSPGPSGPDLPSGPGPGPGAPELPSGPNGCVPGVDCPPPGPPPGPPVPKAPPPDPSPDPEDPPLPKPQGACTPGVDCTEGKPDERKPACTPGIDCPPEGPGPDPDPKPDPCNPGDCPPPVTLTCPPGVDCESNPLDPNPETYPPELFLPASCMPGVDCGPVCAPGAVCSETGSSGDENARRAAVPEPATFALVILGLFALAWMLRRKPAMRPKPD